MRFGHSAANWPRLQADILQLATNHDAAMRLRQEGQYGKEYEIIGEILTPGGRTVSLKSSWYLNPGEAENLRFVTAHPA